MGHHAPTVPVKVWDLPTRLFHWSLVALIAFAWLSGEFGWLDLHMKNGYAILTLILFRILWGFVGSSTARFTSFVKGPAAALAYARTLFSHPSEPLLGHNPLGGLMVVALMALVLTQGALGLFADADDGIWAGPLNPLVSAGIAKLLTTLHKLLFNLLTLLVALHVGAALFYLVVKHDNLIRPMVTGIRQVPATLAAAAPKMVSPLLALPALALAAGAVWWVVTKSAPPADSAF